MNNTIYNLLNVRKYFQSELDAGTLKKIIPGLQSRKDLMQAGEQPLRPAYERYVKDISHADMAVSWETACFLYEVASINKSLNILDLGSGFSSYVLRSYVANMNSEARVTSVDDNESWLEKTKSFMESSKLSVERILTWTDFQKNNKGRYDLIFHDLGGMKTRAGSIAFVLTLLTSSGVAVLDDMNEPTYSKAAKSAIKDAGLSYYSARKFTVDGIGRFSGVVIKP